MELKVMKKGNMFGEEGDTKVNPAVCQWQWQWLSTHIPANPYGLPV